MATKRKKQQEALGQEGLGQDSIQSENSQTDKLQQEATAAASKSITAAKGQSVQLLGGSILSKSFLSKVLDKDQRPIPTPMELLEMIQILVQGFRQKPLARDSQFSMGLALEQMAAKYPNKPMVLFEGKSFSWKIFNELTNRYAHMFVDRGVKKGDCVALIMENRLDYMASVMGLCKVGAVAGLVNINLTGDQLLHSVSIIKAKKIIIGEELIDSVSGLLTELELLGVNDYIFVKDYGNTQTPSWCYDFLEDLMRFPMKNPAETPFIPLFHPCYYIFTSGTTGLPKAAVITHDRWLRSSQGFARVALRMKAKDRIYLCLPLYHSSAMYIGFGTVLLTGASMFLRRRFSARHFWAEAKQYNTNCFAYIGEMCRYLLHQPVTVEEMNNPIVKCSGNGLRSDIWLDFKKRFKVERICEFYGSSEGNSAFINAFNKNCTIGFSLSPYAVIQYDNDNEIEVRDKNGFCKPVKSGFPGLLITQITEDSVFEGYTNKEETEKKIMRNVFQVGDAYFNTGDLIKRVDVGLSFGLSHYQFVDRTGDTFRWQGENISTSEVSAIINKFDQVELCSVYGVVLPHTEGRAGMAVIKARNNQFNVKRFARYLEESLSPITRPVFLRLVDELQAISTFKLKKRELKEQSFHPTQCSGILYVQKPDSSSYVMLDNEFYKAIMAGDAGY